MSYFTVKIYLWLQLHMKAFNWQHGKTFIVQVVQGKAKCVSTSLTMTAIVDQK